MKSIIKQFGFWRLLAMILTALPLLLLPAAGMWWMWQAALMRYWLILFLACSTVAYLLHKLVAWREHRAALAHSTRPDAHWPPGAQDCWDRIEQLARQSQPDEWPLEDPQKLALLGRNSLEVVAQYYHPKQNQPLLELTVPHALLIIERASRELRRDITDNLPFSHKITLGDLALVNRWRKMLAPLGPWWRLLRAVVTPQTAVFSEIRRALGNQIMDYGFVRIKTWMLQEYVRKVGYHAIELYSGQVVLGEADPVAHITTASRQARAQAETAAADQTEPLRIVVLGHVNAGKSSLINALFGQLTAPADILPNTTPGVVPYHLQRDGQLEALIFDTPGCDTSLFTPKALKKVVMQADLMLWVTAANRADRHDERTRLDRIRTWLHEHPQRRPPPLITAISHIDLLRPAGEWQPPYDLNKPDGPKAESIAAAVRATATDLNLPPNSAVPVCLAPARLYNVADTLWSVILEQQDEAKRARFLRCLEDRRRLENWQLALRQLVGSGRLLYTLPGRLI